MSTSEQTEIERKYDVDAEAVVPDLGVAESGGGAGRVPEVARVERREPVHLRAVYHDSDERLLLRSRATLRRRTGGHDEGWHLKLPPVDGAEGRREVHVPLGPDDEPVPSELRDLVAERLGGAELAPVLVLETTRTAVHLLAADGAPLAELADDRVAATDHGAGVVRRWREWEVELAPGIDGDRGGALLDAVEAELLAVGARESTSRSKLARGLGDDPLPDLSA
jgi:inorganic triphosphatase YgiF